MTGRATPRNWSEAEKAEAVGLSWSLGVKAAAKRVGTSPWNIYHWRKRPSPAIRVAIEATRQDVARSLWQVVEAGSAEALRRIRDPKTRAGELAQLLKVAAEQHALLTGGPTAITEATVTTTPELSWTERAQLRDFLASLDAAIDAGDVDSAVRMVAGIREGERLLAPMIEAGMDTAEAIARVTDELTDGR